MASFSVLYEDNDLLVVNKPAKREVEGPQKNSLVSDVNHYLRRAHSPHRAYLCHRLDKDTSGALLFAKGKENQKILMQQFKDGKVKKTYYAFVHGRPARPEAIINEAIAEKTHRGALVYKPAITKYKVLEYRAHYSVLAIEPLTGRTNQIRIHCKRIGHPLIGDRRFYVKGKPKPPLGRSALHAETLSFFHPKSKEALFVKAPRPADLVAFLNLNP